MGKPGTEVPGKPIQPRRESRRDGTPTRTKRSLDFRSIVTDSARTIAFRDHMSLPDVAGVGTVPEGTRESIPRLPGTSLPAFPCRACGTGLGVVERYLRVGRPQLGS